MRVAGGKALMARVLPASGAVPPLRGPVGNLHDRRQHRRLNVILTATADAARSNDGHDNPTMTAREGAARTAGAVGFYGTSLSVGERRDRRTRERAIWRAC